LSNTKSRSILDSWFDRDPRHIPTGFIWFRPTCLRCWLVQLVHHSSPPFINGITPLIGGRDDLPRKKPNWGEGF
jgi:hypothetical protein